MLGNVKVNKQGQASITTTDLTGTDYYRIERELHARHLQRVREFGQPRHREGVPVPLNVPTVTTLQSPTTSAEGGQNVPAVNATVKNAVPVSTRSTPARLSRSRGSVAFLTTGPNPSSWAKPRSRTARPSSRRARIKNTGPTSHRRVLAGEQLLRRKHVGAIPILINPTTLNAPTVTSLQAVTNTIETGEPIVLNATVQNADSSLANGVVEFVTVANRPIVLGTVPVSLFGQQVSLASFALRKSALIRSRPFTYRTPTALPRAPRPR